MSTFVEIKNAIDTVGQAFEAYKETNDQRIKALEKGNGSEAKELGAKLEKIEADVSKWSTIKTQLEREHEFNRERLEALEARASNPKKTAAEVIGDEYKQTFISWVRKGGRDGGLEAKMDALAVKARQADETKAVNIASDLQGGYAVPEEISRMIEKMELIFSPVRSLVKVVTTNTSDYKELVSLRGAASGWVGESGSRSETASPTLRQRTPTHGELYAYPKASNWSLQDIFFNVEEWLTSEVADEFAYQEGLAVISGNGSSRPTGMLATNPVLGEDFGSPLRNADAYQYVVSDTDVDASPSDPGVRGDSLIDLIYTLRSPYRARATWTMNSTTTGAVRKLKDANGQYHWQPGLQAGQPNMLLGYPVATWEQMPDVGAGNFPIAFGDFQRGYVLVQRPGMTMIRDQFTTAGFTKFYIARREGGTVLNNDAIKFLRTIN